MGNEDTFRKTVQLNKNLANEFRSVRQFLNGSKDIPTDNIALQTKVMNRAIEYAFQNDPMMKGLNEVTRMKRSNGTAKVSVEITRENWFRLVSLLMKADECDFVQLFLDRYICEVKVKRCLP